MAKQWMKQWINTTAVLSLLGAVSLCISTAAWSQTAVQPDRVVVAGWSKPITEITNLLVDEEKGFFKAQHIEMAYLPGAGGGDALRNLLREGLHKSACCRPNLRQ
jgi:NitT/TauT family transport system substrate-binding protein